MELQLFFKQLFCKMKLRTAGHYSCSMQEVLYCAQKAGVTHILKAGGAQVEQ
jgi:hypothetical protein